MKYKRRGHHAVKEEALKNDGTDMLVHAESPIAWRAETGGPEGQVQLRHIAMSCLRETKEVGGGVIEQPGLQRASGMKRNSK